MRNPLFIFDFDDTLAISGAKITVKKASGEVLKLNSREFAKYSAEPGDDLNFSEFDEYPPAGVLINDTVRELINAINSYGPNNVWILTARRLTGPVAAFLSDKGIDPLPNMKGTAGSAGKGPWLKRKLESGNYDSVYVWEDCQKNIASLGEVAEEIGVEYFSTCVLEAAFRKCIRNLLLENFKKKKTGRGSISWC